MNIFASVDTTIEALDDGGFGDDDTTVTIDGGGDSMGGLDDDDDDDGSNNITITYGGGGGGATAALRQTLLIDRDLAISKSSLLKESLEPRDEYSFTIPEIYSEDSVRLVFEFMQCQEPYVSPLPPIESKDLQIVFGGDNCYSRFLAKLTQDQLFGVMILSNWLDCRDATDATVKTLAMMVIDLTPEQMRHVFQVPPSQPRDVHFAKKNFNHLLKMSDFQSPTTTTTTSSIKIKSTIN